MLFKNEKYTTILQLDKKYGLEELENARKNSNNYVPNILWLISTAAFLENKISKEKLYSILAESFAEVKTTESNLHFIRKNTILLEKNLPELKGFFKSHFG